MKSGSELIAAVTSRASAGLQKIKRTLTDAYQELKRRLCQSLNVPLRLVRKSREVLAARLLCLIQKLQKLHERLRVE